MSDTGSVGNFYVDSKGIERPIRYNARDLVNLAPPPGYVWKRGHPNSPVKGEAAYERRQKDLEQMENFALKGKVYPRTFVTVLNATQDEAGFYDYYVAARA